MEGSDCDVTISDGEFEKRCDEKGGVSDANERLRGVTNQKKVKWLLDPAKYGIPVYEQSQMTPEGGTKYVFEWDDGIFNEDWISDGYRWRNYSLLAQLVRPSIRRMHIHSTSRLFFIQEIRRYCVLFTPFFDDVILPIWYDFEPSNGRANFT